MGGQNQSMKKGFISRLRAKARKFYINYSMITAVYMMEPVERYIINIMVLLFLATMLYSSWVYLPHYSLKMLSFLGIFAPPPSGMEAEDIGRTYSSSGPPISGEL